jgi:hypothetical protein
LIHAWKPGVVARRGLALACVLVAACAAPKPPSAFEEAFDDETRPWQEVETQLPAKPLAADIVPFQVSGGTDYRFGIDAKSLSIGTDGVYRYTLVATSSQGARNVSYEGIRCETGQKKIYAIGRSDGTWTKSRSAAWTPISDFGINRQDAALLHEYFCPDGYAARTAREVFARMGRRLPSSEVTADRIGTIEGR